MEVQYLVILVCFLQINYSLGATTIDVSNATLACITFGQVDNATIAACKQRDNKVLWREIYLCHTGMSDEVFDFSLNLRNQANFPDVVKFGSG